VERFVAEREVGDDVAFDHRLEERPLEPGRIAEMAANHAAVGAKPDRRQDIAAETLDDRQSFAGHRRYFDPKRSGRQFGESREQAEALLDLRYPDPDPCVHIAVLAD